MIKGIEEKKEAKRKAEAPEGVNTKKAKTATSSSTLAAAAPSGSTAESMKGIRRSFHQRKLGIESNQAMGGKIKSVLSSVFGR